ncbi:hypothetical protein GCM10010306_021760 [Streptomyces umbrinus]|uniref:hypothetical protein n=1 Tax=Streptomyces umbrinus TaxID=67370 RepID=UPI001998C24A|nr:hypothetical protein [Streptomyces umbrinus]GHB28968.1 hypothetical protein GCM10010306_021760 [Streptomyces umbrinus]
MAQKEKTYDFPQMLIGVQDELGKVRSELKTLLEQQPWSVEPMPAWSTHETAWRRAARPESPGWDPADQEHIARLRAREAELVTVIVCHPFWSEIEPAERMAARSQLKHHRERATKAAA